MSNYLGILLDLHGKKILIVRLSSLGDILLTTPLIRTLKVNYGCRVSFVVREEYRDLISLNPYIDKIFLYSRDDKENSKLNNTLEITGFDAILDLQNNFRSLALIKNVGGKVFRFRKKSLRKMLLVKTKINLMKELPQIPERYASAIPGFALDEKGIEIFSGRSPSQLFLPGKKYIGMAPGSRHFTKKWPAEYFVKLAGLLSDDGYSIALFGGKDDKEICAEISEQLPGSLNLSNGNDILQTYADMQKCHAFVCNDSGLMHTASATGKPLIAIFGSTVKEFGFTPYKTKNLILENKSLSCRPCTHIGREECPLRHFKCMLELTPQNAYDLLKAIVNI